MLTPILYKGSSLIVDKEKSFSVDLGLRWKNILYYFFNKLWNLFSNILQNDMFELFNNI